MNDNKKILPPESSMTHAQQVLGWLYLPLHMFVLPLLFGLLAEYSPDGIQIVDANLIYYTIGVVFVLAVMMGFLRRDFDNLLDRPGRCVFAVLWALAINYALSTVSALCLLAMSGDAVLENPNTAQVVELSAGGFGKMKAMSVFMAPVVEEVLFRGVAFGSIRKRNRAAAYILSIAMFAVYHVWQSAAGAGDPRIMLYALQYIPVSVALTCCYEISGSIWTNIFFHMGYNALAFTVLGAM